MFYELNRQSDLDAASVRAFEAIVCCYEGRILRYIYRMIKDYELSADLLQETFLAAYVSLVSQGKLRDYASSAEKLTTLQPLLYTIARNKAITELRRRRCVQFVPFSYTTHLTTEPNTGQDELDAALEYQITVHSGPNLESQVITRDELKRAFARLGRSNLTPLLLHLGGFSYKEIEQITGETMSCIKSKIFRSKQSLQEVLLDLS